MTFDGLFLHSMIQELESLVGARITKIHQPSTREVIFAVRHFNRSTRLLCSAHSIYARIQETTNLPQNPQEPPMFCVVLRKYLDGATIENFKQIGNDRILHIEFRNTNDLGDRIKYTLVLEIMGRHSNIILLDQNNMIIDAIKHLTIDENTRPVLPRLAYTPPPASGKLNPFTELAAMDYDTIGQTYEGISGLLAQEITYRQNLRSVLDAANTPEPTLTTANGKSYFSFLPLEHLGGSYQAFATLSELLDYYYLHLAEADRIREQTKNIAAFVQNQITKNQQKLKKLTKEQQAAQNADILQQKGNLLLSNLHQLQTGLRTITVDNYFDPELAPITIDLDPAKNGTANANSYFKRYNKAKTAQIKLAEQIELTQAEIDYFEEVAQNISIATTQNIHEIRQELELGGYLRPQVSKRKERPAKTLIDSYESPDGTMILVGKNNLQNDMVTFKKGSKTYTWLHAKDIPGSHVVICSSVVNDETLQTAALLAAYFSKSKNSANVPVDYTLISHVHKPNGAKPGFVIYTDQKTLYVTPDEATIQTIKKL